MHDEDIALPIIYSGDNMLMNQSVGLQSCLIVPQAGWMTMSGELYADASREVWHVKRGPQQAVTLTMKLQLPFRARFSPKVPLIIIQRTPFIAEVLVGVTSHLEVPSIFWSK
jgi:hypothetical protein